MEAFLWFLVFCLLLAGSLAVLAMNRRLLSQDLPEEIVTLVLLREKEAVSRQLEAIAAQMYWMDSDLLRNVWLVDCSPDGGFLPACEEFCRENPWVRCCRLEELGALWDSPGKH